MKHITFILSFLLLWTNAFAQSADLSSDRFRSYSQLMSPEKVYLHTDRDMYNANDTIWVSGYIENASYNSEFKESNYIYVELLRSQLNINLESWTYKPYYEPALVKRIKLRRERNGGFRGYLVIPEEESTGKCIIRGYTYWMLNRPVEYMFYKEITVTNPFNDDLIAKMKEKGITDKDRYARLNAVAPIDNKDAEDTSAVNYDIQFLPESGHAVSGTRNTIWVKAVDNKGNDASIWGEVRDSNGNRLTSFRTDSTGAAKFAVIGKHDEELSAHITDSLSFSRTLRLPAFEPEGVHISGNAFIKGEDTFLPSDRYVFEIYATPNVCSRKLYTLLHNGTEILMSRPLEAMNTSLKLQIGNLQPGTYAICVVDSLNNVYAERPLFVPPTGDGNRIKVATHKKSYGAWEKVVCKLTLPDYVHDTLSAPSHVSVSVTDSRLVNDLDGENIESYFLLKSELKGYVKDAGYCFRRDIPLKLRMARGEMLMQTHGWRYYETPDILKGAFPMPEYGREYTQTLSGEVKGLFANTKKPTMVSFVASSINLTAMGQVDSGYFVLKDISFPEGTEFIVSAIGRNGRKGALTPYLYPDYFAPVHQYPLRPDAIKYSKQYKDMVIENLFGESYEMSLELDPVVVTSSYITLKNSPSPLPNIRIKRDRIRDERAIAPYAKSYDILSYVVSQYPSVRIGENGTLVGKRVGASGGMTAGGRWFPIRYFLNGVEASAADIEMIPLEDVENLAYLEGLDASAHTGDGSIAPVPVLMVRTKGTLRERIPTNVSSGNPIGWQRPRKFYSPNYEKVPKVTDLRVTLFWAPYVKFNEKGEAWFQFWTKHKKGPYRIEVEGTGGFREYIYGEHFINAETEE